MSVEMSSQLLPELTYKVWSPSPPEVNDLPRVGVLMDRKRPLSAVRSGEDDLGLASARVFHALGLLALGFS